MNHEYHDTVKRLSPYSLRPTTNSPNWRSQPPSQVLLKAAILMTLFHVVCVSLKYLISPAIQEWHLKETHFIPEKGKCSERCNFCWMVSLNSTQVNLNITDSSVVTVKVNPYRRLYPTMTLIFSGISSFRHLSRCLSYCYHRLKDAGFQTVLISLWYMRDRNVYSWHVWTFLSETDIFSLSC